MVHVCQRWRRIIYGSPSFFDLHLYCSAQTPFRGNLSNWPEFPLTLHYVFPDDGQGDLIAALECIDRVHSIELIITEIQMEMQDVFVAMRSPFPALTHLDITGLLPEDEFMGDETIPLPGGLMGRFMPYLQHLRFDAISCPSIPDFLSSARGLVTLHLEDIPPRSVGHISPGDLIRGLAGLPCLTTLCIKFQSWRDIPHRNSPADRTHIVLPALTHFVFRGDYGYLEILVAHISTPRLEHLHIEYLTPFQGLVKARQLSQFVGRTGYLGIAQFSRAQLSFDVCKAYIKLDRAQGECRQAQFSLTIQDVAPLPLAKIEAPVPRIAHVLRRLAMSSDVGHLSINVDHHGVADRLNNSKWPPLLRLFPAVEALHVSGSLAAHFAKVLDHVAEERVTDVFPALRLLRLGDGDELVGSAGQFLAWRQCTGRHVNVVKSSQGTFFQ